MNINSNVEIKHIVHDMMDQKKVNNIVINKELLMNRTSWLFDSKLLVKWNLTLGKNR